MELLSEAEKDKLARHLTYSATVGGNTFLGLGLLMVIALSLPLLGVTVEPIRYEPEVIGGLLPLLLAFFLPAIWLFRRRPAVRAQLDGSLQPASGNVTKVDHTMPSRGWFVTLEIRTPSLTVGEATLQSFAQPPWQVGEEIDLLFLPDNGRFFPRHLAHNSDMGRIFTPRQQTRQRSLKLAVALILGVFILFGIAVSIING